MRSRTRAMRSPNSAGRPCPPVPEACLRVHAFCTPVCYKERDTEWAAAPAPASPGVHNRERRGALVPGPTPAGHETVTIVTSDPAATARRRRRQLLGLALVGLVAALGYLHWSGAQDSDRVRPGRTGARAGAEGRPVPVVAEPVARGDIQVFLTGIGTVSARNTVTVRSRVDGQLMRVAFHEGQTVRAGDLLAEIDPRPFEVQLHEAEGALARDQALLANARIDVERYRTLYHQDSGSKQQWDTQKALVEQYEGAIKTDQAQIESAKLQLDYCRITAPIGGRTGLRQVDPGNIVHAADTAGLVVITELQPISVLFTLPEADLPAVLKPVRAGERLSVDAFDRDQKNKLASGFLLTLDNQIDPATGTIRLKAEFPNEDGGLFPNQFVNARVLVDTLHDATLVPTAAVQRGVKGTYVYVVGPQQTVSARAVSLGPTQGDHAAVLAGLTPGDLVVVDGVDKLREGAKVELGDKTPAPATGEAPAAGSPQGPAEGRHRRSGP
jgi:membrane fusion protein, multidrug efflux system